MSSKDRFDRALLVWWVYDTMAYLKNRKHIIITGEEYRFISKHKLHKLKIKSQERHNDEFTVWTFDKDINCIPQGNYCYRGKIVCPYWKKIGNNYGENGHCDFLEIGDQELTHGLLWDQVKECGINWL